MSLPAGKVFQAGTLSGNPLATAAGIATLKVLRDTNPYPWLERLSARLAGGLAAAAQSAALPVQMQRCGSMMTLFFADRPVQDWDSAATCDTKRYARYFWGMLDRGVYMPCSQFEALFVSAAHTEADIDATVCGGPKCPGRSRRPACGNIADGEAPSPHRASNPAPVEPCRCGRRTPA